MGFFKRVKAKAKNGRGDADDPDSVMEALEECWDEIAAAVNALEGDDRDQFMEEINATAPENAMTPFEMLCGTWSDFQVGCIEFDDTMKGEFCKVILNNELVEVEPADE